jgi:putative flippase GtrA
MKKSDVKSIVRFGFGGIFGYFLRIFLTFTLTDLIQVFNYFYSYLVTLILLSLYTFFYNTFMTFRMKKIPKKKRFFLYELSFFGFIMLDLLSVKLITELVGLHYLLSISITTIILFFAKYFVYKFILK